MSIHGEYTMDDSKYIRHSYDEDDELVRVHLHEDLYDRLKPVYDWFNSRAAGISIESMPDYIDKAFEWLSTLVFEADILGFRIALYLCLIRWVRGLVSCKISLSKFTYRSMGFGNQAYGAGPFGATRKILELPVEG